MKKTLNIIALLVGLFVVLPLGIIAAVLLTINPNDYKNDIESLVQNQTGREFKIEGDMSLSLFPWLGFELSKVTLGNAKNFGPKPFAHVGAVELKLQLMPLLKKEVQVSAISLNDLELNLAKNKKGVANWADLSKPDADGAPAAPAKDEKPVTTSSGPAIAALAIEGVQIKNATINWRDESTNAEQSLRGLNLRTGALTLGKPFDVNLDFGLTSNQPPMNGQVAFSANVKPDLVNQEHLVSAAKLHIELNIKDATAPAEMKITTDMRTERITFKQASEQLALNGLQLDVFAKGGAIPGDGVKLASSSDINVDLKKQTLDIGKLALDLAGQLKATLALQGTQILDKPTFNGTLSIAAFNPRQLLESLGQTLPEMQNAQALQHAEASLSLATTPSAVTLKDIALQLDKTKLSGQLALNELNAATPGYKFNFDIDQLKLDEYLPPTKEGDEKSAAPSTSNAASGAPPQAGETTPLDLTPLRQLKLDGQVSIGKLVANKLHFEQIRLDAKANNGLINLQPKAKLYGGQYNGNIQLNAQGDKLITTLNEQLSGLQAGPFLKDLIEQEPIDGKGDVQLQLTATGAGSDEILRSLSGTAAMVFKDGTVNGLNIGEILRDAQARLKGEKLESKETIKTDFAELSASFKLKDGVARNDDLAAKSPLLRVTGKGDIHYVEQRINYVATATIVGTSKGQGGRELDELKGLPLDIKIKGPFSKLKFDIDLAAALKEQAKGKVKEKVEEVKAEQKQKLEEKKQEIKSELKEKTQEEKQRLEEKAKEKLESELKKFF